MFLCSLLAILLCLKRSTIDSHRCSEVPKGTPWILEMKPLMVSLNLLSVASPQAHSSSIPLNLCCGAGNFGKIWSECEQHEIECVKWRTNKKFTYIYTSIYNFTCTFDYTLYAINIQGITEITPIFGGVTARAVEGIQWWEWSRWLAAVLPFLDDAMDWSGEHRGFVVKTFFKNNESDLFAWWHWLARPVTWFNPVWFFSSGVT